LVVVSSFVGADGPCDTGGIIVKSGLDDGDPDGIADKSVTLGGSGVQTASITFIEVD
jgi:hypothetical protein